MEKKICTKCKEEKLLSEFYKKYKNLTSRCKICLREEIELYAIQNVEKIKNTKKLYKENNKEKIKEIGKLSYLKNKERTKEIRNKKSTEYRINNQEKIKKYRKENNEKHKAYMKTYFQKNKSKQNAYYKNKKRIDPLFKLRCNITGLISAALKNKSVQKNTKTLNILGCSYEEFKHHLEKKFTSKMNWNNQGSYWHLDHIKPMALAQTEEEVYALNHYTNFQPLYWLDNLLKGKKYNGF